MRVLLVHAHPDPESFGAAVRDAAVAGLRRGGHHVDVIDLAAIDYWPCLEESEYEAYDSIGSAHPDPVVAEHISLVSAAEGLVFVYPTFWSGLPAVLKGWLDRTLLPGVAFHLDPRTGRIRGGLGHVRRIVGITTFGSPRGYRWFVGDAGRRTIRTVRLSCGWRCRTRWLTLDAMDRRVEQDRTDFLDHVERSMAAL